MGGAGLTLAAMLAAAALLSGPAPGAPHAVQVRETTVTWRHWNHTMRPDGSLAPLPERRAITSSTFTAIVLENEFLRATLVPGFGGRVLSLIHKPTGKEALYQNPVGAPYAVGLGHLYYDWLMIYGGIFPSFPEPEHGKGWSRPWSYEILSSGPEQASVRMRYEDKTAYRASPARYDNGVTGLVAEVTVTLQAGRAVMRLDAALANPGAAAAVYEWWTCASLAPGSTPGDARAPGASLIVAPLESFEAGWSRRGWLGRIGTLLPKAKLERLSSWRDQAIAYAPRLEGDWWGVINLDERHGIIRVADNRRATPGLKVWTWGDKQGRAALPETSPSDPARPYVELWAGHTRRFFDNASLEAGGRKSWRETYYPLVGLDQVDGANERAAVSIATTPTTGGLELKASVFATTPGTDVRYSLGLRGAPPLAEGVFKAEAERAYEIRAKTARPLRPYTVELRLAAPDGEELGLFTRRFAR